MPWFKVDDKLHSHKKVAKAGDAMALWVVAGSWCSDQLTDGFVPDYMAGRLVPGGGDMAGRLVEAGLWVEGEHDGDEGWWFHDWEDKNPTADEVEAKREAARERMRQVRANRKDNDSTSSDEVRANNAAGSPSPVPVPVPEPEPVTQDQPLGAPAGAGDAEDDGKQRRAALFEALVEVSGWDMDNLTKSARGRTNRAAKELDDIGASPEGVRARAEVHRVKWPDLDVTPNSIATNYQMLDGKALRDKATGQVRTIDTTPTCVHCQQAVDAHDDGMCDNGRAEAA